MDLDNFINLSDTSEYMKKFNIAKKYFGKIIFCSIMLFFYIPFYIKVLQSLSLYKRVPEGFEVELSNTFLGNYSWFDYFVEFMFILPLSLIVLFLISVIVVSVYKIALWLLDDIDKN